MMYSLKGKLVNDGDILDVLYDPVEHNKEHQFGIRTVVVISVEKGYLWGLNMTNRPIFTRVLSTDINVFKNSRFGLYEIKQLINFLYARRKNIMKSRFRKYKLDNILAVKKNVRKEKQAGKKKVKYSKAALKNMREKLEEQLREEKVIKGGPSENV